MTRLTKTSYELLQRTLYLKQEVNKLEIDLEIWYGDSKFFNTLFAVMPSHELDEMAILIKKRGLK